MKKVFALLLVLILATSAFVGCGEDSKVETPKNSSTVQPTATSTPVAAPTNNSAYDAVFENTGIVHFQMLFGVDVMSFAQKSNGMVHCADYGYKDDIIKTWVETIYISVEGLTDDQKVQLENTNKAQFAVYEALSCCDITYKTGERYLTITITFKDVDKEAAYTELYQAGISTMKTHLSMSKTEPNLLQQGFIKK